MVRLEKRQAEYSGHVVTELSENALQRRIKRWLRADELEVYIQAIPGLEALTQAEAASIVPGASFTASHGGVSGTVPLIGLYALNRLLRTGQRVLLRLDEGWAGTEEALFNFIAKQPWEVQFGFAPEYRLHATARSAIFEPGDELTNTIHKGIERRYADLGLRGPTVGESGPELYVRLFRNRCQLSLNTSGPHLHLRGTRTHVGAAPLRETLAAALVLQARATPDLIIDPFCGSGTILVEAAAVGSPVEREFGFEHAAWHQPGRYREAQRQTDFAPRFAGATLLGFDIHRAALAAAEHNVGNRATLSHTDALTLDFAALASEHNAQQLFIATNLPYGKRIGQGAAVHELVRTFVAELENAPAGTEIAVLTAHPELFHTSNLEIVAAETVQNGGLSVTLIVAKTRSQSAP